MRKWYCCYHDFCNATVVIWCKLFSSDKNECMWIGRGIHLAVVSLNWIFEDLSQIDETIISLVDFDVLNSTAKMQIHYSVSEVGLKLW